LSSGSMTYVVDKLEKKGLLERVFCEKDRRVTYISITQTGIDLIRSYFPQHAENIKSLMAGLSPEEQNSATNLLRKLGLSVRNLS